MNSNTRIACVHLVKTSAGNSHVIVALAANCIDYIMSVLYQ